MKTKSCCLFAKTLVCLLCLFSFTAASAQSLNLRQFVSEECYSIEDDWVDFAAAGIDKLAALRKHNIENNTSLEEAKASLAEVVETMRDVMMKHRAHTVNKMNELEISGMTKAYVGAFVIAREGAIMETVLARSDGVLTRDRIRRKLIDNCLEFSRRNYK